MHTDVPITVPRSWDIFKKKAVGGRERPPRGRREMCWGSGKLALRLFGHRLGCPVVHICNLNFSTSLLGIPVSASELFISAFISHILHCGPTVDLDPQSRADLSNLFHSNNSHTINHPGRVEQPTALSSALKMPHLRAWPFGLLSFVVQWEVQRLLTSVMRRCAVFAVQSRCAERPFLSSPSSGSV